MGINFDGVNPEQKAKLSKIVSDGVISADEVKGLTEAEKSALIKALGGTELPETGEIRINEPSIQEEKGFWDGVKDLVSSIPVQKVLETAGKIMLLPLLLFGSCTTADQYQEMEVDVKITKDSKDSEIIEYLRSIDAKLENIDGTLKTIIPYLIQLGCDNEKIISILQKMGKQIGEIIVGLAEAGEKGDNIIKLIIENNNRQEEILEQLTAGMAENKKAQEDIKELLKTIIAQVSEGITLTDKNNELLTQILAKISTINDEKGIELLQEILAKLTESIEQNKEMDTKTHDLLKQIIEKMDKLDNDMKSGFSNIINVLLKDNQISESILQKLSAALAKLDKMDQTNKAAFGAIINAINNLGAGTDKKLEAILNAIINGNQVTSKQLEELRKLIEENNKIAQGTQDVVRELKDSMSQEHKAILEKLEKGNASLDEIKALLAGVQQSVDNGNVILVEIKDKLNLAGTVLNNILANTENIKDETKALLLKILAKIPNGCNCQELDLSELLEILNKILEELDKDPQDDGSGESDNNHEGILNDLDKMFQ